MLQSSYESVPKQLRKCSGAVRSYKSVSLFHFEPFSLGEICDIFISSHSLWVIYVKMWYSGWGKISPRGHSCWVKIHLADTPVGVEIHPADPSPLPVLGQSAPIPCNHHTDLTRWVINQHADCRCLGARWAPDHQQLPCWLDWLESCLMTPRLKPVCGWIESTLKRHVTFNECLNQNPFDLYFINTRIY